MNAPPWLTARPIAHRGLHDRSAGIVENSIAAAKAAVERGFAIECDVQDTADGEVVVFHDHTLDRLTGASGVVKATSLARMTALTLTDSRETVPTLQDFLAAIAGRTPLVLEIKSRFDGDPTLTRRTLAVLEGYEGPVCVKSFDPQVVALVRDLAPQCPRGIVAQMHYDDSGVDRLPDATRREMTNLLHFPRTEPDFVSWRVADLPCAPPFLCRHLRNMPVMTWTVRDRQTGLAALEHADQIVFEGFVP
ncbi:MAG TPA: glycerophosphodiester phosphodiesterase [Saliniramus sp.]|nr:glycerophosphodiester phosphodiesterase [Saliniramus sp.]